MNEIQVRCINLQVHIGPTLARESFIHPGWLTLDFESIFSTLGSDGLAEDNQTKTFLIVG